MVAAFGALAVAALSGCAGGSTYAANASTGGGGNSCVGAIAPTSPQIIGLNLTNPDQAACNDSTYLMVKGYFGGATVTTSQVVSIMHSATNLVAFMNLDIQPHTAASLGTWTGSYPASGPSASATPSPKNTDISAAGFTTGNLDPAATSKNY